MAVPILFELNQELTRLFTAGSRLSAGDPRLKKFVVPLKKYGEKAPIFLKLAECIEELLEVDANLSAQKLIETTTLLLSVLSTQGDTAPDSTAVLADISYAQDDKTLSETNTGYRTLSPIIDALTRTGSGRIEIVRDAFEKRLFKDARLYKVAVDAIGDKYGEIADYMANTVLPSMGEEIYPFLLDGYNVKGGNIDGRRLSSMHKIKGMSMLGLVDEAIEKGSAPVKAEAVKIMSNYPEYEDTLLNMLNENKSVREEVMKALVRMDSRRGIDKLIEIYNGTKANTVVEAISYGTGEYLANELLKVTHSDYEAVKKDVDTLYNASKTADDIVMAEIQRLRSDISALKNKCTADTSELLKKMLSEEYLMKADTIFPKGKKQVYYYTPLEEIALETLYLSGDSNDFIWEMFENTQQGTLGKIFNPKKQKKREISKMLYCYAFKIGARKLDAAKFYDTFFKTDLYKEIAKYDNYAFQNIFLRGENSPVFSKKITHYFVKNMKGYHFSLAIQIVTSDDHDTLNLLAEHLKNNLEKNIYNSINHNILTCLGEKGYADFEKLYELFCSKAPDGALDREYWEQFLIK